MHVVLFRSATKLLSSASESDIGETDASTLLPLPPSGKQSQADSRNDGTSSTGSDIEPLARIEPLAKIPKSSMKAVGKNAGGKQSKPSAAAMSDQELSAPPLPQFEMFDLPPPLPSSNVAVSQSTKNSTSEYWQYLTFDLSPSITLVKTLHSEISVVLNVPKGIFDNIITTACIGSGDTKF